LLAAGSIAVVWYLRSIVKALQQPAVKPSTAAAGLLILTVTVGWMGQGAEPPPAMVFLLPGSQEAPDEQTVLAPPEVLEQLQTLSRRGTPLRKAALVRATYDGTVTGSSAAIKAEFQIYAATDDATPLRVPLGAGAQLKEALLDGAPAHLQFVRAA